MLDVEKANIREWLEDAFNANEQITMLARHRGVQGMSDSQRLAFIETASIAVFGVLELVTGFTHEPRSIAVSTESKSTCFFINTSLCINHKFRHSVCLGKNNCLHYYANRRVKTNN